MTAHANVERFDLSGRLGAFARTPSGGLRIPAFISRTGVQVYQDAEGSTVREYRPPAEVLAEASYRSFEGAPVTRLHPPELVTPQTWRSHAIGVVQNVRPDGNRLTAELVVEDAAAIAEIEAGELVETSAGYVADVEAVTGEADGETYDAVQRSIRGNHVALGPSGWGRAGPSVALRIDAAREIIDSKPARPASTRSQRTMSDRPVVTFDGIQYPAGSDSHLQAVDRFVGRLTVERDQAVERADGLEKALAEATARADAASSAESVDELVSARIGLLDQARRVLGDDYEWQGKADREIMSDALAKAGHKVAEDASDDRVAGAFEAVVATASKGDAGEEEEEESGEMQTAEDGGRGDSRGVRVATVKVDRKPSPYTPPRLSDKWRR